MSNTLATRAVFFATDYGFFIPTMVPALQLSRQLGPGAGVDILVILVDFTDEEVHQLSQAFQRHGVRFLKASSSSYELTKGTYFHSSHVPPAALARLCVGSLIPTQYRDLIYMDGDVQIVGNIVPLLRCTVPDGRILAAIDPGPLAVGEPTPQAKRYRNYTAGLGLRDPSEYFNSGVMALTRTTLLENGPAALRYFRENSRKCFNFDQSALNAIFVGRREYLSPRYNFMGAFHAIGAETIIDPAIIHFTDREKPWHDPLVHPWMAPYAKAYTDVLTDHPVLQQFLPYMRTRPSGTPYMPGRAKTLAMVLVINPIRRLTRRRVLRRHVSRTAFAVT